MVGAGVASEQVWNGDEDFGRLNKKETVSGA
jgi:hypothetical protein